MREIVYAGANPTLEGKRYKYTVVHTDFCGGTTKVEGYPQDEGGNRFYRPRPFTLQLYEGEATRLRIPRKHVVVKCERAM